MRRVIAKCDGGADRERGAVAVVTALLLVVLLAAGALAVDGGMLYAKRAQLQSGADAAAIAVAQKCGASLSDTQCSSTSPLATSLAQSNMYQAQAGIASLTVNTTAQTVTAATQPLQPGMQAGSVSLFLAQTLGITSATLGTTATAAWGSPSKGIAPFPLAFSVCQVQGMVGGAYQLLQDHGSGANPSCGYGPSGAVVPGGFGWLVQDPNQCGATIDIALSEGGSVPGNSGPSNCDTILNQWATAIQAGQTAVVLLPVFTAVSGTGSSAIYTLAGFAAFKVLGWKFSGGTSLPSVYNNQNPNGSSALACTGNCRGIIGQFIKYVDLDSVYQLGPSTSFGATIVKLTN
ncbi:Flp pilus assembly protein TadG [Sinomonas atrocyanea]|uniref:pilus assembly protein TadG-related protein n=1 Tax=Sinomonas atrocyanea TaxID=37927 RepID=UPI002783971B|nr:pilus assembly protein TadG-related protein [Sinomonas atrocyanea]MDP9884816.1 Flp pilus assembly protein TadG [Sinomonas atrocyanea]